jgi:hypothetical protein
MAMRKPTLSQIEGTDVQITGSAKRRFSLTAAAVNFAFGCGAIYMLAPTGMSMFTAISHRIDRHATHIISVDPAMLPPPLAEAFGPIGYFIIAYFIGAAGRAVITNLIKGFPDINNLRRLLSNPKAFLPVSRND